MTKKQLWRLAVASAAAALVAALIVYCTNPFEPEIKRTSVRDYQLVALTGTYAHPTRVVDTPITDAISTLGPGSDTLLTEDSFSPVGGYLPRTHDPRSYFMTFANKRNDYLRDRQLEQESVRLGIPFVMNLQYRAMTELMCAPDGEPVYDRTQEHLGSFIERLCLAVYLHGLAGDLAAEEVGEQSLVATDLLRFLPKAWETVSSL